MEIPETVELEINNDDILRNDLGKELNNIHQFNLKLNKDVYKLIIEISSNNDILFNLRQTNNISFIYYEKKYKYEDILKHLNLEKNKYNNILKILEFFDVSVKNEKVKISKDNNKNKTFLVLILNENNKVEEYCINLEIKCMTEKKMLNIIIDEINKIKNKENLSNDNLEINQNNVDKNNDLQNLENKLKKLDEEVIKINKEKEEIYQKINKIKNTNANVKNEEKNKNIIKNEIKLQIKINKNDIGKDIYFFDPDNYLTELNESNIDLIINNIKYDFNKKFPFFKIGLYYITLKFKTKIKSCFGMFRYCYNLINIDLSSFDSQNVTNMSQMFCGCNNLISIDLSSLNTKNVSDMSQMFYDCNNLKNINLSNLDTHNLTDISEMFYDCKSLTDIDLSSFNTEKLDNMNQMFYGCDNLININLSSFNIQKVKSMNNIFNECFSLKKIIINKNLLKIKEYFDNDITEFMEK